MTNTSTLTDGQQLQQLNASFIRNFINQDTVAHNEIIHKNFICIQSNGSIVDRDTYMKGWASGHSTGKFSSFTYTDIYIKKNGRWWCVQAQITAIAS